MNTTCLECGSQIKGRADKKFCDDSCRNSFNNKKNSEGSSIYKKTNSILRKNHIILTKLNPTGKSKVSKKQLTDLGFNFEYFTSIYTTKENKVYSFCYNQGFLPIENNFYILVTKKDSIND